MPIPRRVFTTALALALMATGLAACSQGGSCRLPARTSASASFAGSQAWQKLDLRFRTAWNGAMAEGDEGRLFECMMKTAGAPTAKQKDLLRKAGFRARAFVGTIVTGSVKARDVRPVAELEFVEVMELAVPLSTK